MKTARPTQVIHNHYHISENSDDDENINGLLSVLAHFWDKTETKFVVGILSLCLAIAGLYFTVAAAL